MPLFAACSSGNYSIGREGQNGQAIEPGNSCQGGDGGGVCATGSYCKFADGACGAQGAGTCTAEPMACTEEYAPVCGCDGKTYGNACSANAAGVSILGTGICTGDACTVDSFGEPGCVAGSFCQLAQGTCNPKNGQSVQGACAVKPQACTQEYAPVCGCDGTTYGNACEASAAGVSVTATGTCP